MSLGGMPLVWVEQDRPFLSRAVQERVKTLNPGLKKVVDAGIDVYVQAEGSTLVTTDNVVSRVEAIK